MKHLLFVPFGKIAGQDEIAVVDESRQRGRLGFWAQVVAGSVWVHVTRFAGYIALIIGFALCLAGLSAVVSSFQRRSRRRRVRAIVANLGGDKRIFKVLEDSYVKHGPSGLGSVRAYLKDRKRLERALSEIKKSQDLKATGEHDHGSLEYDVMHNEFQRMDFDSEHSVVLVDSGGRVIHVGLGESMMQFAREGLIKLNEQGKAEVDPAIEVSLVRFEDELKRKKLGPSGGFR